MPVRLIDIVSMPPRSQESSTVQKNLQDHITGNQYKAGEQFQSQVQHNMKKMTEAKKKEEGAFQFDAKDKGQNKYENMYKKKHGKQKKKPSLPSVTGSSFDITI